MDDFRYISRTDKDFPSKLNGIIDPPAGIYVKGELPDENKRSVAIVGARKCSGYGLQLAEYFASNLAAAGVQIISGLARGIDGRAQECAVKAGGKSFGILGCGINVVYPQSNSRIFDAVVKNGGLISERKPDDAPLPAYFVQRNRIISALCDILLVIEAREKSGTGITVNNALMQGKDIFVVPGRLTDPLSAGCNRLISQGAGVALNPETILLALDKRQNEPVICTGKKKIYDSREISYTKVELTGTEKTLYSLLDIYPKSLDEILRSGQISLAEAFEAIINLQLKGVISECGKNHYVRKV